MILKRWIPLLALGVSSAMAQAPDLGAGIDKADMDTTVQPGADFYRYAGGNWMRRHPLPPEYSRYGSFEQLAETNQRQLHELIEGLAGATHPHGSLEQKIGDLYQLAMDSARRDSEGCSPLKARLSEVEKAGSVEELALLAARMSRVGVGAYLNLGVGADLKNSKMNIVGIGQGGISMGNRDYYLATDEATAKVRASYEKYVARLFKLAGASDDEATRAVEAVMRIETALARASKSPVELRDPEANYHKMAFTQLLEGYPGIDWSGWLRQAGFPAIKEVDLNQPEAIRAVEKVLREVPLADHKAYVAFKVLDHAASWLSSDFRAAAFDFYGRAMSGTTQDRAQWKRAVAAVDGMLGEAVGRMYVEKYFPASSKQRMLSLVADLQQTLGRRIEMQTWMSRATKDKALEKLRAFYVKIGYPDQWMDYAQLDIDPARSYYENMCRAAAYLTDYYIQHDVNRPVDRDRWKMTPQTINAYYDPTTNEICFPAGILQPPFFDPTADDAANYGAIGVVIGHEMTHGFDDQGSQFDKDGNLKNWWTSEDRRNFEARTKVMADYFDAIEVLPGLHANGRLTLGENIADHGGLNIAYQALQEAMRRHPLEKKEGLTPEQRFFLSYARVWFANIRDEEIRRRTKDDPHALGRWRVNGALPHIGAWYDAFGIGPDDALYVPAEKRVDIW